MSQPKNITYLLGAGASANCLPVIDELPKRLELFKGLLLNKVAYNDQSLEIVTSEIIEDAKDLIEQIDKIGVELLRHKTIDTVAKKLYLIKECHPYLVILKKVLIVYFLFEQSYFDGDIREGVVKQIPDKRYDALIATIISKQVGNLSLPNNFKIITWNYDLQFEIAYREYLLQLNRSQIQEKLQAIPSPSFLEKSVFDPSKFCLIRLNGVAGFTSAFSIKRKLSNFELVKVLIKFVHLYKNISDEELSNFIYSWENPNEFLYTNKNVENIKEIAKQVMSQTDILVIIGYSFPLFNRSIDKELISACAGNAKKIYIQDPRAKEIQDLLVSSFADLVTPEEYRSIMGMGLKKTPVEFVSSSYDQFLIPYELDL